MSYRGQDTGVRKAGGSAGRAFAAWACGHAGARCAGTVAALIIPAVLAMTSWTDAGAAVRSLLETRQDRVVIQTWDLSCGAAALATILKYQYDEPITERAVALELMQRKEYLADPSLVQARQGFSLLDLQRAVDRLQRYKGVGLGRLSLPDLTERAPIIVPVDLHGYHHFVVFRGVYRGQVLLADPAWGNRTMPVATFARVWREYPGMGRIGFLVTPHDGILRPNRLAPRPRDFVAVPADFDDDDRLAIFRRAYGGPILLAGPALDVPVASHGSDQTRLTGPAPGSQTLPVANITPLADVTDLTGITTSLLTMVTAPMTTLTSATTSLLTTVTEPLLTTATTTRPLSIVTPLPSAAFSQPMRGVTLR